MVVYRKACGLRWLKSADIRLLGTHIDAIGPTEILLVDAIESKDRYILSKSKSMYPKLSRNISGAGKHILPQFTLAPDVVLGMIQSLGAC